MAADTDLSITVAASTLSAGIAITSASEIAVYAKAFGQLKELAVFEALAQA
ncbi:hypothetical protein ACIPY6_40800 [Streptomyces sp. NPDC090054]|uniref:hypothetical protein n=1 Tax=Streptomyces sp. NPDC090054 TaxID=3365933 RepID=UPI0037FC58C4